jgi:hypothetical protein
MVNNTWSTNLLASAECAQQDSAMVAPGNAVQLLDKTFHTVPTYKETKEADAQYLIKLVEVIRRKRKSTPNHPDPKKWLYELT